MRLAVVFQGHGDNVYTDDKCDKEIQVMTGTQVVDHQADVPVAGIVW